jgi:hypothetical protein
MSLHFGLTMDYMFIKNAVTNNASETPCVAMLHRLDDGNGVWTYVTLLHTVCALTEMSRKEDGTE